jgi:hypothetical protein
MMREADHSTVPWASSARPGDIVQKDGVADVHRL